MGMPCSICLSPFARDIDAALLDFHQSYSAIALRYRVGRQALYRHRHAHLARQLRQAKELQMLASTESLIAELNRLQAYVNDVLERGKQTGDDRLILLAVKEGRGDVESLAKLGPLSDFEQRLSALEANGCADGHDDVDR